MRTTSKKHGIVRNGGTFALPDRTPTTGHPSTPVRSRGALRPLSCATRSEAQDGEPHRETSIAAAMTTTDQGGQP